MPIDIGASASDRSAVGNNAVYKQCYIEGNPSTETGTVKRVRIFMAGSVGGGLQIGSMYKTNGNTFSSRDWGIVTQPSAGLNEYTQWQHLGAGGTVDIEMEVQSGDYIAVRMWNAATGNGVDIDTSGGLGRWRTLSEDVSFPFTDKVFDLLSSQAMSLNGDFETVGGEDSVVYPTNPLLRASGIRRTFWSGLGGQAVYQVELALGGMSTTYVSPIGSRDIPSAVTPAPTKAVPTREEFWGVYPGVPYPYDPKPERTIPTREEFWRVYPGVPYPY